MYIILDAAAVIGGIVGGIVVLLILFIAVPVILIVVCVCISNKSSRRGPHYVRVTNPTETQQRPYEHTTYSQQLPTYTATDPNASNTGIQQIAPTGYTACPTPRPTAYSQQQAYYPPATNPQQAPYVPPVQLTDFTAHGSHEIPSTSATNDPQPQGQSDPDPTDSYAPQQQDTPPYSEEDTFTK